MLKSLKMPRVRSDKNRAGYNNIYFLICDHVRNAGFKLEAVSCRVHWLACIAIFCFLSTYVSQVIAVFIAKDDPERLFECVSVLSFCGMGVYKLIIFLKYSARWHHLLGKVTMLENQQLSDAENTSRVEYDSDDEDNKCSFSGHISSYTGKFKSTSTILVRVYSSTAVIHITSPFVEYTLRKFHGDDSVRFPHVLPGWTPLDNVHLFGYIVAVLCEAVAAIYCVCVHIAFDLTSVGLMIFACGQYSLLRDYSEHIGGKGRKCNITKERDARAHLRIIKCHRIHLVIVSLMSELDRLIKNVLGVYFFVATLTLCSVAVRLKTENMSTMQLVSLLQYMCATLTQLFLYCSFGDAVFNESSVKMGEGPFGAAHWCLSPRIRRELMTLGVGMMKPHPLHAGPFNPLDLPSFIQIVRTAYSYYAVLGQK